MSCNKLSINASIRLPDFTLEIDETIPLDGYTAIYGPSGSGKTTLLSLIAGFLEPDRGRISFNNELLCDTESRHSIPPHRRSIGSLFQDSRLFPHQTVEQNLHYAEKRCTDENKRYSYEDVIDALDLFPLLERRPSQLSGGEAQRVALARTLLVRPRLLLLDEPLSALDGKRKQEITPYLATLPELFGIPALYVSHDPGEVLKLTDQMLLLENGRVQSFGPTARLLSEQSLETKAGSTDACSILTAIVTGHDELHLLTHVEVGKGTLSLPINRSISVGSSTHLQVVARNVALATSPPSGISIRNILPATIRNIREITDTPFNEVILDVDGHSLKAQITRAASRELRLRPDQPVHALIKTASFADEFC